MRILLAGIMLLSMLPGVAWSMLRAFYQQQKISVFCQKFVGCGYKPFSHRTITIANRPVADLDRWLHYLRGNLDLVGPAPITIEAASRLPKAALERFDVAPGIVSPYQVKLNSGTAYHNERQYACMFVSNDSLKHRIRVLLVWAVQRLVGVRRYSLTQARRFSLFGVTLDNMSMNDAVQLIIDRLADANINKKPSRFAFVNADCVNHYVKDAGYKAILRDNDAVFADGIGVRMAAKAQGVALIDNINGTDMFMPLCRALAAGDKRVFLLGAKSDVLATTVAKLNREFPDLTIAGYSDGYSCHKNPSHIRNKINDSQADLLLVAMGAPAQERWIDENYRHLKIRAVIGVGGLFDFYSGHVSRAPEWLRELCLEWLWRLAMQPLDKGHRYLLGNPLFLLRVYCASFNKISTRTV